MQCELPLELNCHYSYAKRHYDIRDKIEVVLADRKIFRVRAEHPSPIELIPYESLVIKKLFSSSLNHPTSDRLTTYPSLTT